MSARGTRNEASRLNNRESGWMNLAHGAATTSRTRHAGKRKDPPPRSPSSSSSDGEWKDNGEDEEDSLDEADEMKLWRKEKPPHERVLLEVKHVEEAFENFSKCPECDGALQIVLNTICITTSIIISCRNPDCEFVTYSPGGQCAKTTMHGDNDKFERMTDYALNVLYVIGFISMGDAHTEAGRLLGLCGLPNDTTMKGRSFSMIEERVGPFIRELGEDIIKNNLIEEVRLSMEEDNNSDYFPVWNASLTDDSIVLDYNRLPKVDASYDMAWQQKGSGHQYNSMSGHGSLFGGLSRRIIGLAVKSKLCCKCNAARKKNPALNFGEHDGRCWKNHTGTSGSMESAGLIQLVTETFDKYKVVIRRLCCDDDSSIRADCQWSNANYLANNNTDVLPMVPKKVGSNKGQLQPRPDKGKLPAHVPEPKFVADPNHRRKLLSGELIKLDKSVVKVKLTMTRMDSTRISKNFSYMARTLKDRPSDEFVEAANAVLEHHFDNHQYCGDWCKRKLETAEQRKRIIKYYRSKDKDPKLYVLLNNTIQRFTTLDKLVEMAHGMDTNVNEAFNQICTWFAPKNKVFCGSGSLHNRLAFAVGINSLGYNEFFTSLLNKLGITITENIAHYLRVKENTRVKRLVKIRTKDHKLAKNQHKRDKLKADTKVAKTEFLRREGTYKKGMNLDDPYGELHADGNNEDDEYQRKPAARRNNNNSARLYCEFCGRKGHATTKHRKCTAEANADRKYRREDGSLLALPPVDLEDDDEMNDDAFLMPTALMNDDHEIDCHENDLIPFDTEVQGQYDSDMDLFHDTNTWEDDSDEEAMPLRTGEV
jgi:hypothetical protein